MKVSNERQADFNGRMNSWIAKQGLIFQLTHGGTGLAGNAPIVGSIIRFLISAGLLLIFAAACYIGFLFWKATGDDLPQEFQSGIARALGVEEVVALGFQRDLSSGSYKKIMAKGNSETFHEHLEASNISFPMEPTSGLFGEWDADTLSIGKLSLAIKAGESDDENAQKSWQSFFFQSPSFTFSKLNVTEVTLTWGYSPPATWGSIIDSTLQAHRTNDTWSLVFRGGTFSQGIFRDFTIDTIAVTLTESGGLEVTEAKLTKDKGILQWSGSMTEGGARPLFDFQGQFIAIPIASFLPKGHLSAIDGIVSGDFTASGTTNDSDGISYQISGRPEGESGITITKEFELLTTLSHLDSHNSYRKIHLNQGSFKLESKGQALTFSEIDLTSKESLSEKTIAHLKGSFVARPATQEELEARQTNAVISSTSEEARSQNQAIFEASVQQEFKLLQFDNPAKQLLYVTRDKDNEELITKRINLIPRRQFRFPFFLEGQVSLAVASSAFENTTSLPGVSPSQEPELPNMHWVAIDLQGMVKNTTRALNIEWEKAIAKANK